jgi:hypothetical protein
LYLHKEATMLHCVNHTYGFSIRALDGAIGEVHEFLFDDRLWTLRYLVVQLGDWIDGRFVLIPAGMLLGLDSTARAIEVALTRQQLANSPDISIDQPVSRQIARSRFRVDYTPTYWGTAGVWGLGMGPGDPAAIARTLDAADRDGRTAQQAGRKYGDPHLHSTRAIQGYRVQSRDGAIGHIADFIVDDTIWALRYVAIAARIWWLGKKVLVPARWISGIDASQSRVMVDAPRAVVWEGPAFDPSALANPIYEPWLQNAYAERQAYDNVISA